MKVGSSTTTYVVNALGQRIKKSGGSAGTVLYMYDEAGHTIGEYTSTGALTEETIWLGDTPVATIIPSGSTVAVYYVITDHLNTPKKISQPSSNKLAWRWDDDPFGIFTPNQNPQSLGTFVYNLRYSGQMYDSEAGLNYNYFRDYDPQVGRYVESDPLGLRAGVNTYAYVGSDPIWSRDPSGLLIRGDGWSNQEWNDIQKAEAKIRNELKKDCSCPNGGSCIPCNLAQNLLNQLDAMIVAYAPLGGDCGWTPPSDPPHGLFLSRVPWNKVPHKSCKPGCLTSALYHELLHTTGLVFDTPTATEPPAAVLERQCIGDLCK